MARCHKCSYALVLLPERAKYKCAKCGSLFPQIKIDNTEFRRYNKFQRQLDIENYKPQRKQRIKLTPEQKRQRWLEYYKKNYQKLLEYCRNWRRNNKEKRKITRKLHRTNNLEQVRTLARIRRQRGIQKALALLTMEKEL